LIPECLHGLFQDIISFELNGSRHIVALSTAERAGIAIDILSDTGNLVAEQMGLVFELPQALRPIYEKFGIDIPAFNGDDSFKLPVPATYIIGQDGGIVYDFVNADYTLRLEPAEIIAILAMSKA
jgi:peroxiredoxin